MASVQSKIRFFFIFFLYHSLTVGNIFFSFLIATKTGISFFYNNKYSWNKFFFVPKKLTYFLTSGCSKCFKTYTAYFLSHYLVRGKFVKRYQFLSHDKKVLKTFLKCEKNVILILSICEKIHSSSFIANSMQTTLAAHAHKSHTIAKASKKVWHTNLIYLLYATRETRYKSCGCWRHKKIEWHQRQLSTTQLSAPSQLTATLLQTATVTAALAHS